ncbi:MAG: hypothetical protein J5U17_09830 [Candidatus Methanoperedens sp.]|nr:hypothetical protein [Candidatus Methanoperedens sp.]MCE8428857.1 hypothetical protein [Candidatus Methanoperedens sp.]
MSILDVTEDKIFETLGKGRDPNFKPIEKVRPVVTRPKKSYTINQTIKTIQPVKNVAPVVQTVVEPVKLVPVHQADENMQKFTAELNELNHRMDGIQKMVKWYVMPQFAVVIALLIVLFIR